MEGGRLFCPRCGADVDADETHGRPDVGTPNRAELCSACYFEALELVDVPEELTVRVCASCGAVQQGNEWVDVGADDYTDVAIDAVADAIQVHRAAQAIDWSIAPEQLDPNTIEMHCTITATVEGEHVGEQHTVTVRIARETCRRCGRIAGNAYAGTVQVRATERAPTSHETDRAVEIAHDIVDRHTAAGDREAFVSEIIDRPEGIDIRVSTTKLGAQIATRLTTEFGGDYRTSETLITEDADGQGVYRVSYAVRLPRFRPGELIDPHDGDGVVLVQSVSGNLKGRRLATGDSFEHLDPTDTDIDRVGDIEDATETTLVAVEDERALQVLDPETYRAITIPRPDDIDVDVDTLPVIKTRAGVHVIPQRGDDTEQ